ncbi:MAG: cytochrome c [candidate division KSB1 bacterium]|nr:cytochrome c [candidate division KSB1 bacterium]MDZ7272910.1 cytochrome c [candidate division KSB1 bacterium]MDZ7284068.1 cytochrome c [candidate division KSB1 bacterium]MDZ7297535.1 cytochrome c [candidate division KSB1 bacterium]MDZ7309107.1 cytochrome c [candidate division KSB1 bacterium]
MICKKNSFWRPVTTLALLMLAAFLTGCRQDMHDQPRLEPLEGSTVFADGRASRPQVPGTIARGQLRTDAALHTGKAGNQLVDRLPVALTPELLARGRERYNIFCAPCHSRVGDGNGMIVQRGMRRPPSFHIQRLREAPVGYFFDVITNGFGTMYSYADRVPVKDRWAIVAYIRALQLSQNATLDDVPAGQRAQLGVTP